MRNPPPWKYLDPGIVDAVRLLWGAGIDTTDSGDGVSKCAAGRVLDFPHVFAQVPVGEMVEVADRVAGLDWASIDMPQPHIEVSYSPADSTPGFGVLAVLWPPEVV